MGVAETVPDQVSDADIEDLDDETDREELRRRYYALLEELRVVLPGTQILVAFLLTVPFDDGFEQLDSLGRGLYGTALVSGILAVITFLSPAVAHRVGARTARRWRLRWSVATMRAGLGLLAVALLSSATVVTRHVFGWWLSVAIITFLVLAIVTMWILIPTSTRAAEVRKAKSDRA